MKTLRIRLKAEVINELEWECLVEMPDDTDPAELVRLLHETVEGDYFEEAGGVWRENGGDWVLVHEGDTEALPKWRFDPSDGKIEEVLD